MQNNDLVPPLPDSGDENIKAAFSGTSLSYKVEARSVIEEVRNQRVALLAWFTAVCKDSGSESESALTLVASEVYHSLLPGLFSLSSPQQQLFLKASIWSLLTPTENI